MLLGQLSVNPQQLICVLYATTAARTPTKSKFICCVNTTQKKLYKRTMLVYYMQHVKHNAAAKQNAKRNKKAY